MNPSCTSGYSRQCKSCYNKKRRKYFGKRSKEDSTFRPYMNGKTKAWRKENPDKVKQGERKQSLKKYDLTPEAYEEKLDKQNRRCACCRRPFAGMNLKKKPPVDHNHKTGQTRDIICPECNFAIGQIHEDIERVENLLNYLKKWKDRDV